MDLNDPNLTLADVLLIVAGLLAACAAGWLADLFTAWRRGRE